MLTRQREPRYENADLRKLASFINCQFQIPDVCVGGLGMCCHSNKAIHGKGKSKKADDQEHASGCAACHYWYDFGPAPRAEKDAAFELARYRTHREYWTRGLLWAVPLNAYTGGEGYESFTDTEITITSPRAEGATGAAPLRPLRASKAVRRSRKTGNCNGANTLRPQKVLPRRGFE